MSVLGTYARSSYTLLTGMSTSKGQWQQRPSLKQHLYSLVPYFSARKLASSRTFLGLQLILSKRTSPIKSRGFSPLQADCSTLSYNSPHLSSPEELASLTEDARDTIVALSSGSGRAGVAVIRVSGPRAGAMLGHGTKACTLQRSGLMKAVCLSMQDKLCGVQMVSCRGS